MAVNDARRLILCASAGAVLIVGLSGCGSASGTPSPAPSDTNGVASSSPGASETATPEEEAEAFPFVLPATCSEFVGAELEAQLLSEGNVFLFGSNGTGVYAGEYYPGSQEVGTPLTCVFGVDDYAANYIEFDVQGLTPDAYQEALDVLTGHEFTESTEGDVKTFALVGAVAIVDAQVHVLRPDSWITIVNPQGGTSAFDETNDLLEIVTAQVYPEP